MAKEEEQTEQTSKVGAITSSDVRMLRECVVELSNSMNALASAPLQDVPEKRLRLISRFLGDTQILASTIRKAIEGNERQISEVSVHKESEFSNIVDTVQRVKPKVKNSNLRLEMFTRFTAAILPAAMGVCMAWSMVVLQDESFHIPLTIALFTAFVIGFLLVACLVTYMAFYRKLYSKRRSSTSVGGIDGECVQKSDVSNEHQVQ